ncbi:MAG: PDZ domain-containing protein [Myxococcota bacterium]
MSLSVCRIAVAAAVATLLGCGGASEQRVAAIEAQLREMKEASAPGDIGAQITKLREQVATVEKSSTDRTKKIEEMLDVLQREVSRMANEPEPRRAGAQAPWAEVDAVLGIVEEGVTETAENQYTVKRDWLVRSIRAMALSGKRPKLAEGKNGGVSIRGVKPNTLPAKLGFKNNDVIRAIGDREVNSVAEISVALHAASSQASVKIQRKKKDLTLQFTLAD